MEGVYSVFSIMVEETLAKVVPFISDETVLAWNLRGDLRRLQQLLIETRDVLQDAEKKHMIPLELYRKNNTVSFCLDKLMEVVYKAEDVIDELAYEILRPKVTDFNFLRKLTFNTKFFHKIKILNHSLHDRNYSIKVVLNSESIPISLIDSNPVVTDSVLLDNPIIGREADASKIVNLLTPSSHQQQLLAVVPIVGMAGLGKTTLAKLVCRQAMSLNLFDVKMWVYVSEKFDQLNFLGQMLRSLNVTMGLGSLSLTNKDTILQRLEKELSERSFLLVLDDVCLDASTWWNGLRTWLLKFCTNYGNFVLVTTRSEQVASIVETSSQHRHTLNRLSDDDCWFILMERAFRNVTLQPNLEAIGMEIAKKCRGVPLAAKAIGGTLGFNRDEEAWLKIRDRTYWREGDNEKSVRSALQTCFICLPLSLKQCFAFCLVFPKGFLILKEDLIRLWMAERFVGSWDLGNEYFHALLANSFFQDSESDVDGNVIKCRMLNINIIFAPLPKKYVRTNFLYVDYQFIKTSEALLKNKVRYSSTIILNDTPFQKSWNPENLRTLYLNDVDMKIVPSSIIKSKHLRCLHVSNTKISPLPESITNISMLQILTLSNCSCEQLPFLGDLPFLKFLKISHMERVKFIGNESYNDNSSEQHALRLFPSLKSLSLGWMENLIAWSPPFHGYDVVIFPLLETLSIQCCAKLMGFPMRYLSALVKMEIKDCEELRFLLDDHKSFPYVTSLSIIGCPKLTYLRNWLLSNESYKEFRVRRCGFLKFIPENLGMQRSLVSLQIYCCKGLGVFSEEILCKLTQLRRLRIGAFSEKLDDFRYLNRIKEHTCLEELEIWGSDVFGRKMRALPNQLQHLASLWSLKIKGFTEMESLPDWLCDLQSLHTISLNYCWHLEHQPTAAVIQKLSNLSHVYIYGCHALEGHKSEWKEFTGKTKIRILFQ